MSFQAVLEKLNSKEDLDKDDLIIVFNCFEAKNVNYEDVRKLVLLWREKGERANELNTIASILFEKEPQIDLSMGTEIVDICGTGGDKSNTFNISTVAAIVASACGVSIIKHSGRSTTSVIGSVDLLEEFGFSFDLDKGVKEECFKKYNLMFVSSKKLRETFGIVKEVCKEIKVPGFVNLLGPLTNPYKVTAHLLGVSSPEWGKLISDVLLLQKNKDALVVCSKISRKEQFLDELSFCGQNYIFEIRSSVVKEKQINPTYFGKEITDLSCISIKSKEEGKMIFEQVLKGNAGEQDSVKEVVALNAGAILLLAKKVKSIQDGYYFALKTIKSGSVWEHFQNFLNCNKMMSRN